VDGHDAAGAGRRSPRFFLVLDGCLMPGGRVVLGGGLVRPGREPLRIAGRGIGPLRRYVERRHGDDHRSPHPSGRVAGGAVFDLVPLGSVVRGGGGVLPARRRGAAVGRGAGRRLVGGRSTARACSCLLHVSPVPILGSVSCTSSTACVAVGNFPVHHGSTLGCCYQYFPLVETLTGTTWRASTAPVPPPAQGTPPCRGCRARRSTAAWRSATTPSAPRLGPLP
jgi:hypothetical protein